MTYKGCTPELSIKKTKTDFPKVKITSSETSSNFIRRFYHDDIGIYESFFILLLNRANNTIGWAKIGQGGVTGVMVDVKIIAKYAIEALASAVIIAHNHPSGTLTPSQSDKETTKQVANTLNIFNCKLLDHIILTEDDYFSFSDEGIID